MKLRRHYYFSGRVQGVGFRYRARYLAEGFSLTGWVRNLPDDRVEMEVQGPESAINYMLEQLARQNYIEIDFIDSTDIPCIEELGFQIVG